MKTPSAREQVMSEVDDLNKSLELYRALVDNSPDLFYRTDLQGRVTFVSPSIYRLTGFTAEEAIGMHMADDGYLYPEEREKFLKELQQKGRVTAFEAQMKHKDGSAWWASTNAHFFTDEAGNVIGVEGITRDISELKAAEEALRRSEERFRLAFHTSPDAITISRVADGLMIDVNDNFTRFSGYAREEVVGKASLDLNMWKNPSDRERLVDLLTKNGYVENLEAEFVGKDGRAGTGLFSARLLKIDEEDCLLMITRNITKHKQLEQELHQTNKFQALGTLAGGVAHDFNNLLMGIQGHASLIKADYDSDPNLMERIQNIEKCIKSATYLTKQLLGLSRDGKYEIKTIDMNELVQNSARMFGRTHKEININIKFHPDPIAVNVDQNQIEQVLLNLFVNAWQAMPDGGELHLETTIGALDVVPDPSQHAKAESFCKVSVADTGLGMDDATRERIFDPFFTTKEKERGTGLGLASAYGIVKNHGGFINVYSEPGRGTIFSIYLPLSLEELKEEKTSIEKLVKGSETVLLVDDEVDVLNVAKAMLKRLGYDVLTSNSGEDAIQTITERGDTIDLVILDLIMPGMDGGKAFDGIREIQPGMRVLLSSGYSVREQASDIINRGCNGFIQKPYDLVKLSKHVRLIIDTENIVEPPN